MVNIDNLKQGTVVKPANLTSSKRYVSRQLLMLVLLGCLSLYLSACSNGTDNPDPPDTGNGGTSGGGKPPPVTGSNPNDLDGDGMPSAWEQQFGLNDSDPSDAFLDSDSDFISNLREYQLGLIPNNPDSDNDGVPDGVEVDVATDPKVLDSVNVVSVCQSGCDFSVIGDALASAAEFIRVKPGNYVENITIGTSRHLFSEAGAENTVISAKNQDHVVHMNGFSSLHGFTISDGHAATGGGIYAYGNSIVIRANIITGNQAVFQEGVLSGQGGGIFVPANAYSSFSIRIEDNVISNNSASVGAGISIMNYSYVLIKGNTINANKVTPGLTSTGLRLQEPFGGGVFLSQNSRSLFYNNVVHHNSALEGYGGGIDAGFENGVFNNTVVANEAMSGSGVYGVCRLIGNIVWNNTPLSESIGVSVLVQSYNIVNGAGSGVGNLDQDPKFVNAGADDYRLLADSPAIDSGCKVIGISDTLTTDCELAISTGTYEIPGLDFRAIMRGLDGNSAVSGGDGSEFDIGAYEYIPPPS